MRHVILIPISLPSLVYHLLVRLRVCDTRQQATLMLAGRGLLCSPLLLLPSTRAPIWARRRRGRRRCSWELRLLLLLPRRLSC